MSRPIAHHVFYKTIPITISNRRPAGIIVGSKMQHKLLGMHWFVFIEIYITNVVDGRIEQLESSRERRWACILGIALFSLELDSILNLDILIIKSRDWTLDEQQVFGRIHLYNLFTIVKIYSFQYPQVLYYSLWDFEQWRCFHPYDQPSFYPWTPCLATKTNHPYQPNDLLHAYNRWYTLRWPVEPAERWDNEWPWDAGWPAKFHRFMTPAKPLPILDTRMMNITWLFFLPLHAQIHLRRSSDINVLTSYKMRCS